MEEIVGLNICYNSNWTKKTYVALYIYSTILPSVTIGGRRNTKTKHQLYRRVISREGQLAVFFEVCAIKNCRRQERGLRTPFLCPTDFYSKKKTANCTSRQIDPLCSWCFVFVFPLPPIVTADRIARCSI